MTIDEAIKHCEEVAEENEEIYDAHCRIYSKEVVEKYPKPPCKKCAEQHRQLAELLRELKAYKEGLKESRSENPNICGDAISRQAVHDAMYDLCDTGETLKENPWRDNPHLDAIIDAIDDLPSVTSQPKKGGVY